MKIIKYKGYTISQANNNHIMICKDNQMLFHASASVKLNEDSLKKQLDFYLKLIKNNLGDDDCEL